jgi:hypothetical protein
LTLATPADEQVLAILLIGDTHVIVDRLSSLLGRLEANWVTRLPLPHGGTVNGVAVRSDATS